VYRDTIPISAMNVVSGTVVKKEKEDKQAGNNGDYAINLTLNNEKNTILLRFPSVTDANNRLLYNLIDTGKQYRFYINPNYFVLDGVNYGLEKIDYNNTEVYKKPHSSPFLYVVYILACLPLLFAWYNLNKKKKEPTHDIDKGAFILYKWFSKRIKLIISDNGIGGETNLLDKETLKFIRNKYENYWGGTPPIEIDNKQVFIKWGEIAAYQFAMKIPTESFYTTLLYYIDLDLKKEAQTIKIYLPDGNKNFNLIRNAFDKYASNYPILNKGFELKEAIEPNEITKPFATNTPSTNQYASGKDTNIGTAINESTSSNGVNNTFDSLEGDFIAKYGAKATAITSKPPIEQLGCFIAIPILFLMILINSIYYMITSYIDDWLSSIGFGKYSPIITPGIIIFLIIIVIAIGFYIKHLLDNIKEIFLTINKESISLGTQTYYWKDISSYYFSITIILVSQGSRSKSNREEAKTTLVIYSKDGSQLTKIKIEDSWDKTVTEIHNAIINATAGLEIEDGGFIKE